MKVRRLREDELYHHGVKGQRWGIRRYQNPDGSLTPAGKQRYLNPDGSYNAKYQKEIGSKQIQVIDGQKTYLSDKQVRNRRNALIATSVVGAISAVSLAHVAYTSGKTRKIADEITKTYIDHKINKHERHGIHDIFEDEAYANNLGAKAANIRNKVEKGMDTAAGLAAATGIGLAAAKAHSYYRAEQRRKYPRERKDKQQNNQVKR
jgi:hypothetical protein